MSDTTKRCRALVLNALLSCAVLFAGQQAAQAAPSIEIGKPESYCVVYCYIRVPFSVKDNGPGQKLGRVFCDFDAEITAVLPVYNGEAKTRSIKTSTIGVFKTQDGIGRGDAEINTGIIKSYFISGKTNSVRCHL